MPRKDKEQRRAWDRAYLVSKWATISDADRRKEYARQKKWRAENREKSRAYQAAWRLKNLSRVQERQRHSRRKMQYGLTQAAYYGMLAEQAGLCGLCGRAMTLVSGKGTTCCIDHDHETGKIRELLCARCNQMIGLAEESREILLRALTYLSKFY